MVEGIECRGRDDPRLPHPSPEQLPEPTRPADRLSRARQGRADRCAEPLGEAHGHRAEVLGPIPSKDARGDDRIHEPGTVQVHSQVMLANPAADLRDALNRVDPAAASVVRILQANQPRPDVMGIVRPDCVSKFVERQEAPIALECPSRHPREPGDAAGLPDVNMRGRAAEEFVAGLRIHADGDLVGHRAGRDEDRSLLADELCDAFLERPDRRVVAVDVVADLRLGHRPTHGGCRLRDRVRSQVDGRALHRRSPPVRSDPGQSLFPLSAIIVRQPSQTEAPRTLESEDPPSILGGRL